MLSVSTLTPWPWSLLIVLPGACALVLAGHGKLLKQSSFDRPWLVARRADPCGVPKYVQVAAHPRDVPVLETVGHAVAEAVAPRSRCGSLAGGQCQACRPGAQRGVGSYQDKDCSSFDACAHRRSRG